MHTIPSNATRVQHFREVKATLRTSPERLLVGIDVAKATHVAQLRHAHTRILEREVRVPNTQAGFEGLWARVEARLAETRLREVVCAVEPTGTYHQALATFLEQQGATVVFVSNHVAHLNRRTLDGTWEKNDPKDAHNLCDLLEQGKVLFYSLPDEPLGELRHLVRLLRRARAEQSACKARFAITLLPQLGPMGDPLPAAVCAALPAPLQRLVPTGRRGGGPRPPAALPPGLAAACADLAAQLTAVQARILGLEAELVRRAEPLPAYRLLRTIPGIGPTVAALLVAEIGDIVWDHEVQSAPQAGRAGHRRGPDGPVVQRQADLQGGAGAPPLGAVPGGPGGGADPGGAGLAGGPAGQAGGGPVRLLQGRRGTGGEAPADRLGGVAERAAL